MKNREKAVEICDFCFKSFHLQAFFYLLKYSFIDKAPDSLLLCIFAKESVRLKSFVISLHADAHSCTLRDLRELYNGKRQE